MEWTREKPTKPGFYWLRGHRMEVYIFEIKAGVIYSLPDDVEWAGPIEPPA